MSEKYAIIDVETTGGLADRERVIEVAIALHDGEKVVDRFESLVNPERGIPYNITRITGIDTEMVKEAPKFYEVAKRIVEITEGAVFVAHNARFDYAFITEEFRRLGYTYSRKRLCTVKMSRRAFPGLEGGYSLGNLIKQFDLKVDARHRAMADVSATVDVFERIIKRLGGLHFDTLMEQGIREAVFPEGITYEDVMALPNETGVYYFHDAHGDVVYVGKSIHIRQRVLEHFRGKGRKALLMERHVRSISYELTGSELVSLLLESEEIRRLLPIINKAQRGKGHRTGIVHYQNEAGYTCFDMVKMTARNQKRQGILAIYEKASMANMAMYRIKSEFRLCDCLTGGKNGSVSCVYQQIGHCAGSGVGLESAEIYNGRAAAAKAKLEAAYDYDCLIIEPGRNGDERAIILIEDGAYQGYGYADFNYGMDDLQSLKSSVERRQGNSSIPYIIRGYLNGKGKAVKVVRI